MTSTTRRANRPTRPFRSRAAVVAFALLGLVQLFVSSIVPFAEARAPSKLGAHVEQPSERRHYVHDEAYCSACIARHLTGTAPAESSPSYVPQRFTPQPPVAPVVAPDADRRGPLAARAPPAPSRLG